MAVPWINLLAPNMGGIGPIQNPDRPRIAQLKAKNGVPFYAGRFYPKNSQTLLQNILGLGIFSEIPPWYTWENIPLSQIWMVANFEDERIISTQTSIERIDVWPRIEGDDLPPWENTLRDERAQEDGWGKITGVSGTGSVSNVLDDSVLVTQSIGGPLFLQGYVGISGISGRVSEYGFYDQELHIINGQRYGQDLRTVAQSQGYDPNNYYESVRIRNDGAWIKKSTSLPSDGILKLDDDNADGYPRLQGPGEWKNTDYPALRTDYRNWVNRRYEDSKTVGNPQWDFHTQWFGNERLQPRAGLIMGFKPSKLDCIVYTIKVSCISVIVPDDPTPDSVKQALEFYSNEAVETLGANLFNNIWYFYWPIRFNGNPQGDRADYLLKRAGINKLSNSEYVPSNI